MSAPGRAGLVPPLSRPCFSDDTQLRGFAEPGALRSDVSRNHAIVTNAKLVTVVVAKCAFPLKLARFRRVVQDSLAAAKGVGFGKSLCCLQARRTGLVMLSGRQESALEKYGPRLFKTSFHPAFALLLTKLIPAFALLALAKGKVSSLSLPDRVEQSVCVADSL